MTVPEPPVPVPRAETDSAGQEPAPPLTGRQRQILRLLAQGDLLWEMADDPAHYTIYHEKRGGDQRVAAALVTTLAEQGWIRQCPNPQADRLDSWEITPEGRALLPTPKRRRRTVEPASGIPPSG
jgi:DNA-binding MarR family transcriptional regulator